MLRKDVLSFEIESVDFAKGGGLVPAIVQDVTTQQVLMLGYMNEAALKTTVDSGLVTFFSRSRNALWTKGESSGNRLLLKSIHIDCDFDTLLVLAEAVGPTCHTGAQTCFSEDQQSGIAFLGKLEKTVLNRRIAPASGSYTSELFAQGRKRIAQKVGEEGLEVALAAIAGDEQELLEESADLLYHLVVLLSAADLSLERVGEVLERRAGKGGASS